MQILSSTKVFKMPFSKKWYCKLKMFLTKQFHLFFSLFTGLSDMTDNNPLVTRCIWHVEHKQVSWQDTHQSSTALTHHNCSLSSAGLIWAHAINPLHSEHLRATEHSQDLCVSWRGQDLCPRHRSDLCATAAQDTASSTWLFWYQT